MVGRLQSAICPIIQSSSIHENPPAFADPIIAAGQETSTAPPLEVSPQDIVSTRTVHDGKRRITFQKLDPEAMAEKELQLRPQTPVPSPPQASEVSPRLHAKPIRFVHLGASVHIPDPSQPGKAVTLLQLWSTGNNKPVASLWVNANFLWLTGASLDLETPEISYSIFLMATQGYEKPPENLPFPADGKTHLIIAEGDPTEEQLAPIDELLASYDREKATLRTNYENRVAQAREAERQRAVDPPEKKDLKIRYWIQRDASARDGAQGGAR